MDRYQPGHPKIFEEGPVSENAYVSRNSPPKSSFRFRNGTSKIRASPSELRCRPGLPDSVCCNQQGKMQNAKCRIAEINYAFCISKEPLEPENVRRSQPALL